MNIPHEKFCVLPWISLEASPIGTVRPCCLADNEVVDNCNKKFNLLEANLRDIQNSKYMERIRQTFLNKHLPKTCRRCWAEEDAGRTSKRMHTLNRLKDILTDEVKWSLEPKNLMFLDLKLGNICNLKCRICGSWSSSTYASEELKALPKSKRKESFAYDMQRKGAWARESHIFWDELKDNMHSLRYIEFTGGEPFMIAEHFKFLQTLIDNNLSQNIEIHYNTNGTLYPEEAEEIWKHFKHVEIAFSIDDVGKRFEYQRTGADWYRVQSNIQRFKKLQEHLHNISLQVCCTINIFNVYYLEEVANWIETQEFDFVYWNMLHDTPQHCITSLPDNAKKVISARLLNAEVLNNTKQEFASVVDFMKNKGESRFAVLQDIRKVDARRNVKLTNNHLELAYLIGYE
jgi:pyruvate-formate lyase-activating enzyme